MSKECSLRERHGQTVIHTFPFLSFPSIILRHLKQVIILPSMYVSIFLPEVNLLWKRAHDNYIAGRHLFLGSPSSCRSSSVRRCARQASRLQLCRSSYTILFESALNVSLPSQDSLWALAFATQSGQVTLTCGTSTQQFTVNPGINKLKLPLSPGQITVSMSRDGKRIINKSPSDFTYNASPDLCTCRVSGREVEADMESYDRQLQCLRRKCK